MNREELSLSQATAPEWQWARLAIFMVLALCALMTTTPEVTRGLPWVGPGMSWEGWHSTAATFAWASQFPYQQVRAPSAAHACRRAFDGC